MSRKNVLVELLPNRSSSSMNMPVIGEPAVKACKDEEFITMLSASPPFKQPSGGTLKNKNATLKIRVTI